jgi:hypothetical protein
MFMRIFHWRRRGLIAFLASSCLIAAAAVAQKSKADGKLVFEEDFENGAGRWEVTDSDSWALQDGRTGKGYGITRRQSAYEPEVRSPGHIALVKDLEVKNFEMTFYVKSTFDTGNHRDCCVFFGYRDPSHFYYVHLGARPDPASGQIMVVDGAPRTPMTENEKLVPWNDEWHKVKLVRNVDDGTIAIYFDDMDQPHMTAKDKRFGKGRIGIGSFDDMNAFDDIRVVELP